MNNDTSTQVSDPATEFNQEVSAAIDTIAAEFPTQDTPTTNVVTLPPESVAASESGEASVDVPRAAEAPKPALTPEQDLAATIIRALEESRAKEREARQARKAEKRALKQARKEAQPPKDEIDALQRMGYDPDLVVRKVLAQKMGDQAPPELRQAISDAETKRQITALEGKVMAQSRELAAREYFDKVARGAHAFLSSDTYHKDAPTVAELSKRDPARVHAEVMQEIINDARARSAREPNGEVMSYATAVSKVEKRWSDIRKLLTPTTGAPAGAEGGASTTTQSQQQASGAKPQPKAVRPPDRPLAPWLQRGDVEERGIREAMDEYRRLESTNKR